jgi:cell division protein FtsB
MQQIETNGRLDEWCKDNMEWVKNTFGADNLVSAVLHLDEQTPHIHATVVPIVTGERRKAKRQKVVEGKRKYKKKDPNRPRLCADDVVTRYTLVAIQDSYAEAMNKYGLRRGIEGSKARHITTQQYYRDLHLKNENLKEDIELLQEQKTEATQELSRIKSGINTEKLKSSAVDVATSAIEGIGSMIGTTKVKRLQQEVQSKDSENAELQEKIHSLKQEMQEQQTEHTATTFKLRQELEKIHILFPKIKELLRIENLCRHLGFGTEMRKAILEMKPVGFKGQLYSSEYKRDFETEHSVAEIKPLLSDPEKLQLTIDGVSDTSWFRQKYREFQESIGIKVKERSRGVKI